MPRRTKAGEAYEGYKDCGICGMGSLGRHTMPRNEMVEQDGLLVCPDCVDEKGAVSRREFRWRR